MAAAALLPVRCLSFTSKRCLSALPHPLVSRQHCLVGMLAMRKSFWSARASCTPACAFGVSGQQRSSGSGSKLSASLRTESAADVDADSPVKAPGQDEEEEEGGRGSTRGLIDVNPPRGTRDFSPSEMRLRTWLFSNFREVSRLFGFEEVDFPVLESEELFVRKAGEEITQQLYNFVDKGGRRVALRPELTPSLARLVLQKGKALPPPVKWFAVGQCWRYERMTRGRRREHYQWNMDILGVAGVEAEAELLSAIVMFMKRVGLTSSDVGIRVSNRKLLQAVLDQHGVPPERFAAVCVVVDKIEKIPREQMEKELVALGVSESATTGILSAMSLRSLDALQDVLGADTEALADLRRLFSLADSYGFCDWLLFDASVVRGLAYYTGTVFEAFDKGGKLRAICGGGRYDRLLSTFGGEDTPACGFGFGDAVIVELLKDRGLLPELPHKVDDIIVALEEELRGPALAMAARLRAGGRSVDMVLESKRLKWVFKQAERLSADRLLIFGSTEWEQGAVKVKNLLTREEKLLPVDEV
eukprot:TRINITY_DN4305_c0_g1_i1.p1 TRINITY_DN4305_c0_g1~~TRINITY_DN4305_c0_g1_i1.p1  ORF type:complete len:530 (-),score=142.10 TRINITY_DN4305_c0_g1_i1:92-1681(-)